MKKKICYFISILCLMLTLLSISHARILEGDFSLSSEFNNIGPFETISLSRIFLENKLSLSVKLYGTPQIKHGRNAKFVINGYPYYASQQSSIDAFGGSIAIYDINGEKADGDLLPAVLSNAAKVELEIPLKNLQILSWAMPSQMLAEWKNVITRETRVHKLSQDQVSQLYISILGRASEGSGNAHWCAKYQDMVSAANAMLELNGVKEFFGENLNENKKFIEWIYYKTLGKDLHDDPNGINYWTSQLDQGKSKGEVIVNLITAVTDPVYKGLPSQKRFYNKMEISSYVAENISAFSKIINIEALTNLISNVDNNSYSVYLAKNSVDNYVAMSDNPEEDDEDEEQWQQPPAPSDLKIRKKDGTHILTWKYPDRGNVVEIEIWIAEGSQRRDEARLAVKKTVEPKMLGQHGEYVHSGFDLTKEHTYWIRTVSSHRNHSVWHPGDSLGGYVVSPGDAEEEDAKTN